MDMNFFYSLSLQIFYLPFHFSLYKDYFIKKKILIRALLIEELNINSKDNKKK